MSTYITRNLFLKNKEFNNEESNFSFLSKLICNLALGSFLSFIPMSQQSQTLERFTLLAKEISVGSIRMVEDLEWLKFLITCSHERSTNRNRDSQSK